MDTSGVVIETGNLILKGIGFEYKDDIFREFTEEITVYMFPKSPEKIEDTIEFIETAVKKNKEGSDFQVVVLDKRNKEFLGCGGIHHIDGKTPEFGIWIKKSAHGHNYGKEAVVALKEWADRNLDYEYLLYPVDVRNYASKRIAEFLGGKIAREYDEVNMSGDKLHLVEYRIYPLGAE